ncbi:protein muscleblind-like [Frankliniella occidentalis]|uniref:Protein muscleblind-like n=1 Tax=Frankliniella occidentalis TaxID=133901 RepID=A0A9C6XAY6_FRAOC|nr:protein muscleblind-like [Frankliniella occidentalis]
MQQMGLSPGQPMVAGQVQTVVSNPRATNPYLTSMPQVGGTFSPYFTHAGPIMPAIMGPDPSGVTSPLGMVQQTVVTQQKMPRSDRLEVRIFCCCP